MILNLCSAVSYFSDRRVSIIGAGRLSFRVRDGSGRFPAAVAAVTLFICSPYTCVCFWWWGVVCSTMDVVARFVVLHAVSQCFWLFSKTCLGVCKFSAG